MSSTSSSSSPASLPSIEAAKEIAPLLDRYHVREVRFLLHLVTTPGEFTASHLARLFRCERANVYPPLAVLVKDGLLTMRTQRMPGSNKPVTLYRAAA